MGLVEVIDPANVLGTPLDGSTAGVVICLEGVYIEIEGHHTSTIHVTSLIAKNGPLAFGPHFQ